MLAPKKKKKQVKKEMTQSRKQREISVWWKRNWKKMSLVGGFLALPVALIALFHLVYWNKVYPGVSVAGIKVGSQTELAAEVTLQQRAAETQYSQPALTLIYQANEWHILKADIDFAYLPDVSARSAYGVGRSGQLLNDIATKWQALVYGVQLPFEYTHNDQLLDTKVASIAAELTIPEVPPEIEVLERPQDDGSWTKVHLGEAGQLVQKGALLATMVHRLAWAEGTPIQIPVETIEVEVSDAELAQTKERADALVGKRLTISSDEEPWSLEAQDFVGFLDFGGGFDREKVAEYVATLAEAIDRPAQDAAFQYVGGRVTEFIPAKDGLQLNQGQTTDDILARLAAMESEEKEVFSLSVPIERSEPTITLGEVNNLGIKELLGKGVSTYRGSIAGRVHNVGLSSRRINGVLVAPGKVFSFNASVGEISGATGYAPAYIIRSGATVLDDGGGTCQTSTTTFRAALDAGLPITERWAHSYRVGYYEQNAKAGLDATVYAPGVDLKFLNDTPAHILVQTVVNTGARTLSVEIYGTNDGRQAAIVNHRVWDVVPAPPPRYQDDPTLPAGTTKQVDYAAAGAKAKFDYVVTRDGETVFAKTFYSNFRPWQAVFLRGTGGA